MKKMGKKLSLTNQEAILIESNDSMAVEMTEFCIIKMICEAKDDVREQMQAVHDHSSNQLKEKMQEAKEHFNKQIFWKKEEKTQKYLKWKKQ